MYLCIEQTCLLSAKVDYNINIGDLNRRSEAQWSGNASIKSSNRPVKVEDLGGVSASWYLGSDVLGDQTLSDGVDGLAVTQDVSSALRVVHQRFDAADQRRVDLGLRALVVHRLQEVQDAGETVQVDEPGHKPGKEQQIGGFQEKEALECVDVAGPCGEVQWALVPHNKKVPGLNPGGNRASCVDSACGRWFQTNCRLPKILRAVLLGAQGRSSAAG